MASSKISLVSLGFRTAQYPIVVPPMGLLYLAAHLRASLSADVRIWNQRLHNQPTAELVREIRDFGAEIVGLSCMTMASYMLEEVTREIRKALPEAIIVIGGPHANAFQEEILRNCDADVVVSGPGELLLEQIVQAGKDRAEFAHIPGIYWRDAEGQIISNPGPAPAIAELDSLPMPAYDLIDLPAYWRRQSIVSIPNRRYISLFSSRGCPYKCCYCHRVFGKRFLGNSAERVVEEIVYFQKQYQVDDIEFLDDIFNWDSKRVIAFSQLLRQRDITCRIAYPNGLRCDILTEETIDALVSGGMFYVNVPLESASPRIQKLAGKNVNVGRWEANIRSLSRRKLFIYSCMLLGFPTETAEEMQQTIDMFCDSPAHAGSIYTLTPFPGTPVYKTAWEMRPDIMENLEYRDTDLNSYQVNLSAVSDAELLRMQRYASRRFFLNPRRIFRLLRVYPKPWLLPLYFPILMNNLLKGSRVSGGVQDS